MRSQITGWVIVAAIIGGLWIAMLHSLNKEEISDCLKWQQWSEQYVRFYLVPWQDEQCRSHGIEINAPVEKE